MLVAFTVFGITLLVVCGAWVFTKYFLKSMKQSQESLALEIKTRNSPDKNVRDLFHANQRVNFYRLLVFKENRCEHKALGTIS